MQLRRINFHDAVFIDHETWRRCEVIQRKIYCLSVSENKIPDHQRNDKSIFEPKLLKIIISYSNLSFEKIILFSVTQMIKSPFMS